MPVKVQGGREYTTVAERVNAIHADHKGQVSITTELLTLDADNVVMKATLSIADQVFTGHSHEKIDHKNPKAVNFKSAVENGETSSIGRALAAAGYHGTEYASADELANALPPPDEEVKALKAAARPMLLATAEATEIAKHKDQAQRRHMLRETCKRLVGEDTVDFLKQQIAPGKAMNKAQALKVLAACFLLAGDTHENGTADHTAQ